MNPVSYATTRKFMVEWAERGDGTSGLRSVTDLDPVPPDGDGWEIVAMTVDPGSGSSFGAIYWAWRRTTSPEKP